MPICACLLAETPIYLSLHVYPCAYVSLTYVSICLYLVTICPYLSLSVWLHWCIPPYGRLSAVTHTAVSTASAMGLPVCPSPWGSPHPLRSGAACTPPRPMTAWTLGSPTIPHPQGTSYPLRSDAATTPDLWGCLHPRSVGLPIPKISGAASTLTHRAACTPDQWGCLYPDPQGRLHPRSMGRPAP